MKLGWLVLAIFLGSCARSEGAANRQTPAPPSSLPATTPEPPSAEKSQVQASRRAPSTSGITQLDASTEQSADPGSSSPSAFAQGRRYVSPRIAKRGRYVVELCPEGKLLYVAIDAGMHGTYRRAGRSIHASYAGREEQFTLSSDHKTLTLASGQLLRLSGTARCERSGRR